ncbi:hypothetical protein Tco_0034525, partial [Tanacetum coccineum]
THVALVVLKFSENCTPDIFDFSWISAG